MNMTYDRIVKRSSVSSWKKETIMLKKSCYFSLFFVLIKIITAYADHYSEEFEKKIKSSVSTSSVSKEEIQSPVFSPDSKEINEPQTSISDSNENNEYAERKEPLQRYNFY